MKLTRIISVIIFCCLVFTGCSKASSDISEKQTTTSEFDELHAYIQDKMPQIYSVVVSKEDEIIFEQYYGGKTENSLHQIRSVTKSVMSALVGIAIEKGFIKDINQTISDYLSEHMTEQTDPSVKEITIKDLLTMTSGIPYHYDDYRKWANLENPIVETLALEVISEPGSEFNYNDPAVHILSGVITNATGMKASEFAEKYLFPELGIETYDWPSDSQGNSIGPAELQLTSRDMLKFGQLYLQKGEWNGKSLVPAAWVEESTKAHTEGGPPSSGKYGYLWWVSQEKEYTSYYAMGYGGQFIVVIPELDLVTVITSNLARHSEENKSLVEQFIIPIVQNLK